MVAEARSGGNVGNAQWHQRVLNLDMALGYSRSGVQLEQVTNGAADHHRPGRPSAAPIKFEHPRELVRLRIPARSDPPSDCSVHCESRCVPDLDGVHAATLPRQQTIHTMHGHAASGTSIRQSAPARSSGVTPWPGTNGVAYVAKVVWS